MKNTAGLLTRFFLSHRLPEEHQWLTGSRDSNRNSQQRDCPGFSPGSLLSAMTAHRFSPAKLVFISLPCKSYYHQRFIMSYILMACFLGRYQNEANSEFWPQSRVCYNYTVIIDFPKKVESIAIVEIVKLCCPLSHLVISLGRRPKASANCFFDNPRSCIRSYIRSEIAKVSLALSLSSAGISENKRGNKSKFSFIAQKFYQCRLYSLLSLPSRL